MNFSDIHVSQSFQKEKPFKASSVISNANPKKSGHDAIMTGEEFVP